MSFAHVSGPLRVGTQRTGAQSGGVMNCGLVELAQVYTAAFGVIKASPTAQLMFTLPAGAKITDVHVDVVTALATATNCGFTMGNVGTPNFFITTFNTGATVVRTAPTTVQAAFVADKLNNVGTADVPIYGTFTAATGDATAGSIVITVKYLQRDSAGLANPTNP
jgi:hypothetical protein